MIPAKRHKIEYNFNDSFSRDILTVSPTCEVWTGAGINAVSTRYCCPYTVLTIHSAQ